MCKRLDGNRKNESNGNRTSVKRILEVVFVFANREINFGPISKFIDKDFVYKKKQKTKNGSKMSEYYKFI